MNEVLFVICNHTQSADWIFLKQKSGLPARIGLLNNPKVDLNYFSGAPTVIPVFRWSGFDTNLQESTDELLLLCSERRHGK